MRRSYTGPVILGAGAVLMTLTLASRPAGASRADDLIGSRDPFGQLRTYTTNGSFDLQNPFFEDLGTNGRACFTCHRPDQGWTITPDDVRQRFVASGGLDPIFRSNDGSNCEGADVGTLSKRRRAFSLLLSRGLIRIGLEVPANAEFIIDRVDDPYACGAPLTGASMYRRPLPSTNLGFLSAVMWDGRESSATTTILQDLGQQADDATIGHAQAARHLTDPEKEAIVAFETGLFTGQAVSDDAGSLRADGARGGPVVLSTESFFIGINDPVGLNPTGVPFDPRAFSLFGAWTRATDPRRDVAARKTRHRARRGDLQHPSDRPHRRRRPEQPDVLEWRHRARSVHRHLHDVPRYARRGQPFGKSAAQHRPDRRVTSHRRHAALHAAPDFFR